MTPELRKARWKMIWAFAGACFLIWIGIILTIFMVTAIFGIPMIIAGAKLGHTYFERYHRLLDAQIAEQIELHKVDEAAAHASDVIFPWDV